MKKNSDLFTEVLNSDLRYRKVRNDYFKKFISRVRKTWRMEVFGKFSFFPTLFLTYHKRFILGGAFLILLAVLAPSILVLEFGLSQNSNLKPSKVAQNSNFQENTQNAINNSAQTDEDDSDNLDNSNTQNETSHQLAMFPDNQLDDFINFLECGSENANILLNSVTEVLIQENCLNLINLYYLSNNSDLQNVEDISLDSEQEQDSNQSQNPSSNPENSLKLNQKIELNTLTQNSTLGNNTWLGVGSDFTNQKIILLTPGSLKMTNLKSFLDLQEVHSDLFEIIFETEKNKILQSFEFKNLVFAEDGIDFEYSFDCSDLDLESVNFEESDSLKNFQTDCNFNQKLTLIAILEKLD